MTAAGRTVMLGRYRIPTGERALHAQRIDGRVAVIDVPVDHDDRVYLVERHVISKAELDGLADEYSRHSEDRGDAARLAVAGVLVGEAVEFGFAGDVAFDEVDAVVMVDGDVHQRDAAVDALGL